MLRHPALIAAGSTVLTAGLVAAGVIYQNHRVDTGAHTATPVTGAYLDFGSVSDGPPPPLAGSAPFGILDDGRNDPGLAVVGGALVHGRPLATDDTGYAEAQLPQPVTRIGTTVTFPADQPGSIVLTLRKSSIVANHNASPLPDAGLALIASPGSWTLGLFDWSTGSGLVALANGGYAATGDPKGPQRFELSRNGSTATLTLPDGQQKTVQDSRIGQGSGDYAGWELYESDATRNPAALHVIWAE